MKEKIKIIIDKLLYALLASLYINISSIITFLGISGLLINKGTDAVTIDYLITGSIILTIITFVFSLLYIILMLIKDKNICKILTIISAILFAFSFTKLYLTYLVDFVGNFLSNFSANTPDLDKNALFTMSEYLLFGGMNLIIMTISSVFDIVHWITKKISKNRK